jgi:hypothetical protein
MQIFYKIVFGTKEGRTLIDTARSNDSLRHLWDINQKTMTEGWHYITPPAETPA